MRDISQLPLPPSAVTAALRTDILQQFRLPRHSIHGPRAAEYASRVCGRLFQLSDMQLKMLVQACMGHTHEHLASCVKV